MPVLSFVISEAFVHKSGNKRRGRKQNNKGTHVEGTIPPKIKQLNEKKGKRREQTPTTNKRRTGSALEVSLSVRTSTSKSTGQYLTNPRTLKM